MDTTVIGALGLLIVIPVGLGIATMLHERKLNKEEQQVEHGCCHECCGCQGCAERNERDEDECGCCGKPLSECQCHCQCHKH